MTQRARVNRPVSDEEIAVLRATLERAPVLPNCGDLLASLSELRVIDRCPCGCASVDFEEHDSSTLVTPIADGIGTARNGAVLESSSGADPTASQASRSMISAPVTTLFIFPIQRRFMRGVRPNRELLLRG